MILMICYDDSQNAQRALETGLKVARKWNSTVYITTSIEKGMEKDLAFIKAAEEKLKDAKAQFDRQNILCETDILYHAQSPSDDLVDYAVKNKVEVMIIGVKKVSKVGKMLFGSTAQQVILDAPCPVLTVK